MCFSQLSAKIDVKCDGMCVFHIHSLQTTYICSHCMMCYTIRKKKCSPFLWNEARFVWFSQFIMTVVQNVGTLSKNAGLGHAHPQKQLAVKVLSTLFAASVSCLAHTTYIFPREAR